MIAPVELPARDLPVRGLLPLPDPPGTGPRIPDVGPRAGFGEEGPGNREPGTLPIDALWSCLRDLADELLHGRAATLGHPVDEGARGDAYVFIADTIAGWVDRAERGDAGGDGLDPERLLEEGMTRLWIRISGPGRCRT